MKKSTIEMMHSYLSGQPVDDMEALRADVKAEYERLTSASKVKMDMYNVAKPIIMNALSEPMTVKELFEKCSCNLPEGMTVAKIQYALLNYWPEDIIKEDCGKNPNKYSRKV